MHPESKFKKWNRWLTVIYRDIKATLTHRAIFQEVQGMIRSNPKIQVANPFYDWLTTAYVTTVAMGIRRQAKIHKEAISLARLLQEIRHHPEVLSRQRFQALFKRTPLSLEEVDRLFDPFAGPGGEHIDPAKVEEELRMLKTKANKIEQLADKRIAHYDQVRARHAVPLPSFDELDECLDFLEELMKKYLLLFRGQECKRLVPPLPEDWKQIFEHPWQ